jgi:pimeloyl-ACP methyl ester carboxylesterase
LQQRNGVYHWANDPRLTAASAFKLSQGHIDAVMAAITMPCLVLLAEQGMGAYPQIEEKLASYASLRYQLLPGSHHFHMEAQAAQIASIASEYFSAGSPG